MAARKTKRSNAGGKAGHQVARKSSLTKAQRSEIARKAAAKAVATKQQKVGKGKNALTVAQVAARKATETKRQSGALVEAGRKAAATRAANRKSSKRQPAAA